MASREAAASKWQTAQPAVLALVLGLVAGPYISNALGWQVTSGTASARARANIVQRLAWVCAAQARMEIPDPSKLDQTARASLADKWTVYAGRNLSGF